MYSCHVGIFDEMVWFHEVEGKHGLILGVMTVFFFLRMFYYTAPSEAYRIKCA